MRILTLTLSVKSLRNLKTSWMGVDLGVDDMTRADWIWGRHDGLQPI